MGVIQFLVLANLLIWISHNFERIEAAIVWGVGEEVGLESLVLRELRN